MGFIERILVAYLCCVFAILYIHVYNCDAQTVSICCYFLYFTII